ncbi:MAG TPA: HAD-IA family hydrolase [Dehalococcoidia bacterium]|nr:HAD-IA family hydrolase [Dehalococcoidia bacterium]
MRIIVLDAMGVIYPTANDNRDLLCPFVAEKGGTKDVSKIEMLYNSTSLGNMSSAQFWKAVGLDPRLEDEYLQRYELSDGLPDFLEAVNSQGYEVWCLSNDISEWSKKLRARFGLDKYVRGFVISGDVGVRKPEPAIFDYLIGQLTLNPHDAVFVDDQARNLDVAAALGFSTILFAPAGHDLTDEKHIVATSFADVLQWLCSR